MIRMVVRISAPAKVNLYLAVGHTMPDGYHAVDTVLQTVALADTVTITPAATFSFSCVPDPVGADAENLAARAARAMAERYGRDTAVSITIEKRIPWGAGLGGASADAAAVIRGLAEVWGVAADDAGLTAAARSLGADVPFFLVGGAALYTGRGDVLARSVRPLESPVVIVKPAPPVPTSAAYAAYDRLGVVRSPSCEPLLDALEAGSAGRAAALLHNAMSAASASIVPEISDALELLEGAPGVLASLMAGSGSAVFGLCASDAEARRVAEFARDTGFWSVATHTTGGGCVVERV
jgi:4-diphosphocytidyl-2-C-methyl-D-erythritol kinase